MVPDDVTYDGYQEVGDVKSNITSLIENYRIPYRKRMQKEITDQLYRGLRSMKLLITGSAHGKLVAIRRDGLPVRGKKLATRLSNLPKSKEAEEQL